MLRRTGGAEGWHPSPAQARAARAHAAVEMRETHGRSPDATQALITDWSGRYFFRLFRAGPSSIRGPAGLVRVRPACSGQPKSHSPWPIAGLF